MQPKNARYFRFYEGKRKIEPDSPDNLPLLCSFKRQVFRMFQNFVSQILCSNSMPHFSMYFLRYGILGDIKIIIHLKSQPERCRIVKIDGQTQCRIGRDASLAVNNLIYSARRYFKITSKLILAYIHWFEKLLIQNFPRMYCWYFFHFTPTI